MSAPRRRFSREFKVEAVSQIVDGGRPVAQVARGDTKVEAVFPSIRAGVAGDSRRRWLLDLHR
jgi:hypothetical protein